MLEKKRWGCVLRARKKQYPSSEEEGEEGWKREELRDYHSLPGTSCHPSPGPLWCNPKLFSVPRSSWPPHRAFTVLHSWGLKGTDAGARCCFGAVHPLTVVSHCCY